MFSICAATEQTTTRPRGFGLISWPPGSELGSTSSQLVRSAMDKWMISVMSVRTPCFPSTQLRNQTETSELVFFTTSNPTCHDFESQVLKSQPETSSEIVPGMLNQKCHNEFSCVFFEVSTQSGWIWLP